MKLSSIFSNDNDKKKRLSHIRNVLGVASIDGRIDDAELAVINSVAAKIGVTKSEIDLVLSNPGSIEYYPPSNQRERISQLYDLVLVMLIDGEIDAEEFAFCQVWAERLGFHADIVHQVVANTIDLIEKGVNSDLAISELVNAIR